MSSVHEINTLYYSFSITVAITYLKSRVLLLALISLYIRIMVCLLCDMQPFCLLFLIFIRSFRYSKRYSFITVQFTGTRSTKRINTTRKLLGFMSYCLIAICECFSDIINVIVIWVKKRAPIETSQKAFLWCLSF